MGKAINRFQLTVLKSLSEATCFQSNDLIPPLSSEQGRIRIIREALGMSTTQLAKRVGIDQSRISRLENKEAAGDLKLSSMQKIADGLGMKFVYAFIPPDSLEAMVEQQAKKIAK